MGKGRPLADRPSATRSVVGRSFCSSQLQLQPTLARMEQSTDADGRNVAIGFGGRGRASICNCTGPSHRNNTQHTMEDMTSTTPLPLYRREPLLLATCSSGQICLSTSESSSSTVRAFTLLSSMLTCISFRLCRYRHTSLDRRRFIQQPRTPTVQGRASQGE